MRNGEKTKIFEKEIKTLANGDGNDNATRRVPDSERKGFWSIAFVQSGFCICMSGLYTGAATAFGMNLKTAVIAIIIGDIILSLYGGAIGAAGAKEGVASAMLSRHSFGRQGSKFVGLLLAVVMLGWFAVQVGFFGSTMAALFPGGGLLTSKYVAAVWGGILMMLTAYFGYKGLNFLSYIAVPLIAVLSLAGILFAIKGAGGLDVIMKIVPSRPMTLGTAIVAIVGSFAGGATAQADITRYAKDIKTAWGGTIFGYFVANSFIILAGYFVSLSTGESDLPVAFINLGLGAAAMIILILAQGTTKDNNLYTASLGLANIIPLSKHKLVIVTGITATIVGALGLADYFTSWLSILGTGIPPVAGVIICDYYILKKGHYDYGTGTLYDKINIWAFVAIVIGAFVGFRLDWGIASINSFAAGFVVYFVCMKLFAEKRIGIVGKEFEK